MRVNKGRRLFFALEPGNEVRKAVQALQMNLGVKGRIVEPDKFHVTLAFLGQQPETLVPRLKSIAASLTFEPCTLALNQTGTFGGKAVFWLGASHVPRVLQDFRRNLVEALEAASVNFDCKPWKFHLTLYRRLRMHAGKMEIVEVPWSLDGFSLIESINVAKGVEYRRLGHWKYRSSVN